jgi:hypothetical protein
LLVSDREKQPREPLRGEAIEKVTLVLLRISGSREDGRPVVRVKADIVTRGNIADATDAREVDEFLDFHAFIAAHTGVGRGASSITLQKIINDDPPERFAGVDHFVGDLQGLGHVLCETDFATASLLPLLGGLRGFVLMFPDLEGDAMYLVTLANE